MKTEINGPASQSRVSILSFKLFQAIPESTNLMLKS